MLLVSFITECFHSVNNIYFDEFHYLSFIGLNIFNNEVETTTLELTKYSYKLNHRKLSIGKNNFTLINENHFKNPFLIRLFCFN